MVSSRDSIPDQKRTNTENFVKELLEALTEIMDKKIHLENENVELKHKCQSQKQKIEAFKELALGEKAFLLGIIRKECCGNLPGRQEEGDARPLKSCCSACPGKQEPNEPCNKKVSYGTQFGNGNQNLDVSFCNVSFRGLVDHVSDKSFTKTDTTAPR